MKVFKGKTVYKMSLTKESKYSEILLNKNNIFFVICIYIYIYINTHTHIFVAFLETGNKNGDLNVLHHL